MPPKIKKSNFDAYGFPKTLKGEIKETIGYAIGKSTLGMILVATFEMGILAVLHGQTKDALLQELVSFFPKDQPVKDLWDAKAALAEVITFIDNPNSKLKYPVFMQGTDFQKKTWQAVQEVPFGTTATYLDIAKKIGSPRAMRAVGSSCTRNKLFLIVPCHRVVRNDYKMPNAQTRESSLTSREALIKREIQHLKTKKKSAK